MNKKYKEEHHKVRYILISSIVYLNKEKSVALCKTLVYSKHHD
jgi:hypothetical protein